MSKKNAPNTSAITIGTQIGESTAHQLQLMFPVSFNPMKRRVSPVRKMSG